MSRRRPKNVTRTTTMIGGATRRVTRPYRSWECEPPRLDLPDGDVLWCVLGPAWDRIAGMLPPGTDLQDPIISAKVGLYAEKYVLPKISRDVAAVRKKLKAAALAVEKLLNGAPYVLWPDDARERIFQCAPSFFAFLADLDAIFHANHRGIRGIDLDANRPEKTREREIYRRLVREHDMTPTEIARALRTPPLAVDPDGKGDDVAQYAKRISRLIKSR